MNAITRSILYLKRHYIKTTILTGLLLLVTVSLSLLLSLNTAINRDIKTLSDRQSKRFIVTQIDAPSESTISPSHHSAFQKVSSRYHLKATHLIAEEITAKPQNATKARPYRLINQNFLEKMHLFNKKQFLVSNVRLSNSDSGKVLVSQGFAQQYGLKAGASFAIEASNGSKHTLTVAGIFKVIKSPIANKESDTLDNNIIATQKTLAKIHSDKNYHTSYYEAKTEAATSKAQAYLENQESIAKMYQVKKDASIQAQLKGLRSQQKLFTLMFWGTFLLSALVLAFFLNLWMKSRQLEIGILQSIGKSRGDILLQYILEIAILASVASLVAMLVTALLLPSMRDNLIRDILKVSYETTDNGELMPVAFLANYLNLKQLSLHTISLTFADISYSILTALALSVSSVLLACLSLLNYPPKKIFAMMS